MRPPRDIQGTEVFAYSHIPRERISINQGISWTAVHAVQPVHSVDTHARCK
jgi:hypothetical protein